MNFFFLSSGLFLGCFVGINTATNSFATAVGSKMIRFSTAAIISSICILFGAIFSGNGTSSTIAKFSSINAIAGAFIVALSAGVAILMMNKIKLPVSSSEAVIGSIIGWCLFSNSYIDYTLLVKIAFSWIATPIFAGIIAIILYYFFSKILQYIKIHIFKLDRYTRYGLIMVGALGAYSLGANNIGNVMGIFIPSNPFHDILIFNSQIITSTHQLFFIGAVAICIGIFTYADKMILKIGRDVFPLSPIAALIVVLAQSFVFFIFSSVSLQNYLVSHNLPSFPLIPVSGSQALIGGMIGIGLYKGGQEIHWNFLGKMTASWLLSPLFSCAICFLSLFIMQNVFYQNVY